MKKIIQKLLKTKVGKIVIIALIKDILLPLETVLYDELISKGFSRTLALTITAILKDLILSEKMECIINEKCDKHD